MTKKSKPSPVAETPIPPVASEPAAATDAPAVAGAQVTITGEPGLAEAVAKVLVDQKTPPGQSVSVTGPAKGRWRCGRHFTPVPVHILLEELSVAQIAAMVDDPELKVEVDTD